MKLSILIIAIIFNNGCSQSNIPVELSLPPALTLPAINADRLECLSDDVYVTLVRRDMLQAARIETLTAIIQTTHGTHGDD